MNTTPRKFYAADIPASGQPDKKLSIYKDGVIYEGYYTSGISHSFDLKLICLLDHCFKDGQNVTGLYTKRYEVDISAGNGKWEPVSAEYFNTCKDEYRRVIAIPTPDNKLTPMAAHIEWLKKERKACYELCHDEQVKCFDDAIKHATSLLEAEREYASQQAPEWYSELLDKEIERINKRLLIEDDNLKQRQLVSEIQYIEGVKQFIKSIK